LTAAGAATVHATSIKHFLRKTRSDFGNGAYAGVRALWIGRPTNPLPQAPVSSSLLSRWSARRVRVALAVIPLFFATGLFVDWQHDNSIIRRQALEVTRNLTTDAERILAVNDWVYHDKGFGKNAAYFIVPSLGPTPVQVLQRGGDCADKSRLVAAMLNELGIDAGLVMIAPCLHCSFIHTVVEARYEEGRMVVDPTWDIDYPAGNGKYLGVRDLAWTTLGEERLVDLQSQRGAADKIASMPATEAKFEYAVAINWDKNGVTRAIAQAIHLLGYQPDKMFRPRLLEDPKLGLCWFLIAVTVLLTIASVSFLLIYKALVSRTQPGGRDALATDANATDG
jgi:hypothetical protein